MLIDKYLVEAVFEKLRNSIPETDNQENPSDSADIKRYWIARIWSDIDSTGGYRQYAIAAVKSSHWYRGVLLLSSHRDRNTGWYWKRAWHLKPLALDNWTDPVEAALSSMSIMPVNEDGVSFGDSDGFDLMVMTENTHVELTVNSLDDVRDASYRDLGDALGKATRFFIDTYNDEKLQKLLEATEYE